MKYGLPSLIFAAGIWDAIIQAPSCSQICQKVLLKMFGWSNDSDTTGFVHPTMTWHVSSNPIFGGMGRMVIFLPQGYINRLQNPFIEYLRSVSLRKE